MKTPFPIYAFCLLLLLGFTWGCGYSIARFAMLHDVPALGYAFWQVVGPAIVLLLFGFSQRQHPFRHRKHWLFFLISGTIGIAIPNTNMYFIADKMPAGLLALLVNTVPLVVYPLALASREERFDVWRMIALIIGFLGIMLIISPAPSHGFSKWALMAMLTPLAFAACSIYIAKKQPKALTSPEAASGMLIAAAFVLTPLVIQQHRFYPLSLPFSATQWAVIVEIGLSSLGYVLFFKLIRLAGPVFYSLTGGVVALTGLFWGYLLFSEVPTKPQILAILCIVSALGLLSWRQASHNKAYSHVQ